ncbi:hypothetical protein ALI144C_20920 [Actinosynnema sp. ALI-1.44]|nr:hypothetical protein ALI144C_20920 [Actinosynnema sp. ALI-1.44]
MTAVLLGAAAVGACSAQPEAVPPQVASVRTSDTSPPVSGRQAQERPRFRIDMTDDEQKALYDPYRKCMSEHGIAVRDPTVPKPPKDKLDAAAKACDPLLPLPAWENDINNPEAFDFNRRVVSCLRAKGVKFVEVDKNEESGMVGPSFGGPQNDQDSIDKGLKFTSKCEQEVAAGGYK